MSPFLTHDNHFRVFHWLSCEASILPAHPPDMEEAAWVQLLKEAHEKNGPPKGYTQDQWNRKLCWWRFWYRDWQPKRFTKGIHAYTYLW